MSPGFNLASSLNLGAGAVWSTNLPQPVVVNGQNVVTNPIAEYPAVLPAPAISCLCLKENSTVSPEAGFDRNQNPYMTPPGFHAD